MVSGRRNSSDGEKTCHRQRFGDGFGHRGMVEPFGMHPTTGYLLAVRPPFGIAKLVKLIPRIVSGLVHPSFFWWIHPTYPIYNWGELTHLLSGMSHQVWISIYWEFHHPNWPICFRRVGIPPTSCMPFGLFVDSGGYNTWSPWKGHELSRQVGVHKTPISLQLWPFISYNWL